MKLTTRYNLKKPDLTDYVSVEDLNENMDILDETLGTHVDKGASTTQKGHVQLSDATNSTSTILAATANAVKKAWDLANGKYSKPSLGIPKADLVSAVQTSLDKSDSALQQADLSNSISGTSQTKAGTELAIKNAKETAIDFAKGFGVGGVAKQVTGNWNDHKVSGLYMGNGLVNEPPTGHVWKFVTVMQHNDSYVVQSAVDFDNTEKYTRALQNGVWSQWKSDGLKDGGFLSGAINFNDLSKLRNKVFQIGDITGSTGGPPMAYGVLVTHNPSNSGYATQSLTTVTTGETFTRVTADGVAWTAWNSQSGVAKGSFVGNRAANRLIPMGFTPKLVMVTVIADNTSHVAHGTSAIFHISGFHTQFRRQSGAVFMPPGGVVDGGILVQVDNDGLYLNYDGTTMHWTAFK